MMRNLTDMNVTDFLQHSQARINEKLHTYLIDAHLAPQTLHEAIQYAVLGGGKRLRPALVYATGECFGASQETLDFAAAAVELIHCYSLIHDDLPAMDNDALRRGKPTCHKAFGEATAILAGDALQSLAFEVLAHSSAAPKNVIQMIKILAHASGSLGMSGGQALDLEAEGQTPKITELENLHLLKTGALIRASVFLGALSANCEDEVTLLELDNFASDIGLAFQIQDDILDIEGNTETLGKPSGSDVEKNKATYPVIAGIDKAKARVQTLQQRALDALNKIPSDTEVLAALSVELTKREA